MLSKYDWLHNGAANLQGAQISFKHEWDAYQFLIGNKMFAMLGKNNHGQEILTLKGEPAHNRAMIEMYDCVTEGYYMNKLHWISMQLEAPNTLSEETILALLQEAYQLVFNKLPKKTRLEIAP